jgi:hypothetical protein
VRTLARFLAHQTRIQALSMALIGAAIIVLAEASSMAATITVHAPDGEGRVFVDFVGKIDDGDFETFKQKTDQILIGASNPKKLVIVTLMSNGGAIGPAMQIGELIRKRGMLTFVPADRTCASACALIWVAGWLRTVGDTPQIGFHAAYDEDTGRESGSGNALMGAYLRDLEVGYEAIHFMTHKGPTSLEWLTPELAKEVKVAWLLLQPPRAIPIPPQQPGPHPPHQVIAAWSKLMPRPLIASPDHRANETVVVKRVSPTHVPPEEVRDDPVRQPRSVTTVRITPSPELVLRQTLCDTKFATEEQRWVVCRSLAGITLFGDDPVPGPWPLPPTFVPYPPARMTPSTRPLSPSPLTDRSGSEPIPSALAYAAQPTPIVLARIRSRSTATLP